MSCQHELRLTCKRTQIPVPVEVLREVPVPVERVMYKEVLVPVESRQTGLISTEAYRSPVRRV
jgi:hypothetical protein